MMNLKIIVVAIVLAAFVYFVIIVPRMEGQQRVIPRSGILNLPTPGIDVNPALAVVSAA